MAGGTVIARLSRWLSREIFADHVIPHVSGLAIFDGGQELSTLSVQAGDTAQQIASDIAETLRTYYDGSRQGHSYQIRPVWSDENHPPVGKLVVKMWPADLADESAELAPPGSLSLSSVASSMEKKAADDPVASWRDQARFNAGQVGALTKNILDISAASSAQMASMFGVLQQSMESLQKTNASLIEENNSLRAALTKERDAHDAARELAKEAVRTAEELSRKLGDEKDTRRILKPYLDDMAAGLIGQALASSGINLPTKDKANGS